tara:strand:+ start:208 stop:471 length:264 start_codon:yes stop_codon:yes gene_type:complete
MQVEIFAHETHVHDVKKVGNAVVTAKRTKHKGFDVFKLYGTNSDGAAFEVNIFMDSGQRIDQTVGIAGEHDSYKKANPANGYKVAKA